MPGHRSSETKLRELLGYMRDQNDTSDAYRRVAGGGDKIAGLAKVRDRVATCECQRSGGIRATHQTPVDAAEKGSGPDRNVDRLLLSYPLPIAFPSVTAWIARATVATLPALRPAMEMRPSFVR